MALPLPNLDDRTYADLVAEARSLIPTYAPAWTDHNPSSPGITLLELFAWLTEMLIYRTNRIPDQHLRVFLKLLNGPEWQPGPDLAEDIRASVVALRQHDRAVTAEDYEHLARAASPDVARAYCVARRNLEAGTEALRVVAQPGHVSVIIIPRVASGMLQPTDGLIQQVQNYLEPRRMLTTRSHVVGPFYAAVNAEILIARCMDVPVEDIKPRVVAALTSFLDPLTGGPEGNGWPFGRDVYISELYEVLEAMPEVDYVPDITLLSQCPPLIPRCGSAAVLWHDDGDQIGLELAGHHLPLAQFVAANIVVGDNFVPIEIAVRLPFPPDVPAEVVRRDVKWVARRVLHPLHDGPNGATPRTITLQDLRDPIHDRLAVPSKDIEIELKADAQRVLLDEQGTVTGVRFELGEYAEVQVTVNQS